MRHVPQTKLPRPVELSLTAGLVALQARGELEADLRCFVFNDCRVLIGSSKLGWHLSISHPRRYPTWDEIAHARYALLPDDLMVAMVLPPMAQYVNLAPNCFHLFECQPTWGRPLLVPGMVVDAQGNYIPFALAPVTEQS